MRIQSSLEFLLLLSVIAVLCLSTLAFYGKGMAIQKEALNGIQVNSSIQYQQNLPPAEDPQLSVYVPLNSTLLSDNEFEIIAYGCTGGNATLAFSSKTTAFSHNSISLQIRNITTAEVQFEPFSQGLDIIGINYSLACRNESLSSSKFFNTYASVGGIQQGGQSFAHIRRNDESLSYKTYSSQVVSLSESNHCTIRDVWTGSIYPVSGQCGALNAWGYNIFDGNCLYPYWSYSRSY